ncbi:uncharacterized protein LOC123265346 [Cotesia glomerata]|uniref:Coilin N-terminal domain-containing protein n=1 Tax=Cotesia glomerata TaxID=32391 RepID=A0AAV7IF62_COTGL|nr:uncharacterized protein LOC123265346 [Cotesia glomerata]KAH0560196.1 hypothetical protein KQX54_002438 [Cotesia glomerata]
MSNSTNFRVKLNLSKFYQDARKLSFIYVDTSAINNVLQLHSKIANIFAITKPFYLSTENSVLFPLIEDIRIVQENDIIKVVPGCPELSNDSSTSNETVPSPKKMQSSKSESRQSIEPESRQSEKSDTTDLDVYNQIETVSENDVNTDANILNLSTVIMKKRRKRGRRLSKKNKITVDQEPAMTPYNDFQKNGFNSTTNDVKVIFEKATPKHLKFNFDDETGQVTNVETNGNLISPRTKPTIRSNEAATLSTLLSLKNNPAPVTYSSKRIRTNSEVSHVSMKNNQIKMENSPVRSSHNLPQNKANEFIESDFNFATINPFKYPIYESSFEINDIIAFRTLKIGEDYSPTVSGYITAKIYAKEHGTSEYVLKIIDGHDQIKAPEGKFALPFEHDENEIKINQFNDELVNLNSSHLVEPRLIYRPS